MKDWYMWGFVCVLFSLGSHSVTCISVTRRCNLSHILGSKQSFIAKKIEAFKGIFPVSFFSGSSICVAFGKISGYHCFDCCMLPRARICRMRTPPVLFLIQAVTSPANCNLPNAFNRKVGESVAARLLCSWLPSHSYFRPDLCGFFQSSGMEWYVAQVYRIMLYLLLEFVVNFVLLRSKPTFSQDAVSMPAF